MSRYYGSLQGSRGEATRQGTPNSGIDGHIRGWGLGVRVWGGEDKENSKKDAFTIDITKGSNGGGTLCFLATVRETDKGIKLTILPGTPSEEEITFPK